MCQWIIQVTGKDFPWLPFILNMKVSTASKMSRKSYEPCSSLEILMTLQSWTTINNELSISALMEWKCLSLPARYHSMTHTRHGCTHADTHQDKLRMGANVTSVVWNLQRPTASSSLHPGHETGFTKGNNQSTTELSLSCSFPGEPRQWSDRCNAAFSTRLLYSW